jgi:NAD+--asparagine ADP-ribosyltransferase
MKKLTKAEQVINNIYTKIGDNVEVKVMDLSKVFNAGKQAQAQGADVAGIEKAMKAVLDQVRCN